MHAIPSQNAPIISGSQTRRDVARRGMGQLILDLDAYGSIVSADPASYGVFGIGGERLKGLRLTDLTAAKAHPGVLAAMNETMAKGHADITVDLRRGCLVPCARLGMARAASGGFRVTVTPLPRKVADDEGARSLKVEQLADVSHEIRTPLNAVIGFADALRQESFGPLGDRRYRDYAKMIQESGQHVLALINDLLDLSKAEADRFPVEKRPVPVRELVESCVGMMRLEAERAGLSITCETSPAVGVVPVDAKIVRQILLNLLSNALKFTDRGGITIRTRIMDRRLVISVQDTGVGMSGDDLKRVGERFYQARREGVRGTRGSGLGLALSSALARAHGGSLDIASSPGRGTTATLSLPIGREVDAPRRYEPRGTGGKVIRLRRDAPPRRSA